MRNINSRKATGPEKIPPKIVKMSANIIDSHLTNIINSDLKRNAFSDSARIASIRPIFKGKGERTEIKNYRTVSILNCFSKVYERSIHENLTSSVTKFLSDFISAYRKGYSTNHVLLRLIEKWKVALDDSGKVASIRPIFRGKGERTKIKKIQDSILNCFSKVYERFLHENLKSSVTKFLSDFISVYRKGYSITHILL